MSIDPIWFWLVSLDLACFHVISFDCTWPLVILSDLDWFHSISIDFIWLQVISFTLTCCHLISLEFARARLSLLDFMWFHLRSLDFTKKALDIHCLGTHALETCFCQIHITSASTLGARVTWIDTFLDWLTFGTGVNHCRTCSWRLWCDILVATLALGWWAAAGPGQNLSSMWLPRGPKHQDASRMWLRPWLRPGWHQNVTKMRTFCIHPTRYSPPPVLVHRHKDKIQHTVIRVNRNSRIWTGPRPCKMCKTRCTCID